MCLAFPNSEYYVRSDFLLRHFDVLAFILVRRYSLPARANRISHRLHLHFRYMPCSKTPRMINVAAKLRFIYCCLLVNKRHRPSSKKLLTGLNHFNLAIYGLQLPLSTLNRMRYRIQPKTKYEMCLVALFR